MILDRPSHDVSQNLIIEKCQDFTDFHVWPLKAKLDYRGWINNFDERDRPLAYHLLNAFMYFSEEFTTELFLSALQSIHTTPKWVATHSGNIFEAWPIFLDSIILTYITGENPNPTDSGYGFTRLGRDYAAISETQIMHPVQALAAKVNGSPAPIVFVDDFVGSGNQFCETWHREYVVSGAIHTFATAAAEGWITEAYYSPAICTSQGLGRINALCPDVTVTAGNFLAEYYSVLNNHSLAWPSELIAQGQDMITQVSSNLGIPADDSVWDYRGFYRLGLALGFAHKTPDATIPLFRWNSGGWQPLVKFV